MFVPEAFYTNIDQVIVDGLTAKLFFIFFQQIQHHLHVFLPDVKCGIEDICLFQAI